MLRNYFFTKKILKMKQQYLCGDCSELLLMLSSLSQTETKLYILKTILRGASLVARQNINFLHHKL